MLLSNQYEQAFHAGNFLFFVFFLFFDINFSFSYCVIIVFWCLFAGWSCLYLKNITQSHNIHTSMCIHTTTTTKKIKGTVSYILIFFVYISDQKEKKEEKCTINKWGRNCNYNFLPSSYGWIFLFFRLYILLTILCCLILSHCYWNLRCWI